MPRCSRLLFLVVALAVASSGCGTMANITANPTKSSGYRAFGPTGCEPFGGVQRSVMIGSAPLMMGPLGIVPAAVAVGVDAPLSLVGDILTLPIVYARLHTMPWDDVAGITVPREPAQTIPAPEPSNAEKEKMKAEEAGTSSRP